MPNSGATNDALQLTDAIGMLSGSSSKVPAVFHRTLHKNNPEKALHGIT